MFGRLLGRLLSRLLGRIFRCLIRCIRLLFRRRQGLLRSRIHYVRFCNFLINRLGGRIYPGNRILKFYTFVDFLGLVVFLCNVNFRFFLNLVYNVNRGIRNLFFNRYFRFLFREFVFSDIYDFYIIGTGLDVFLVNNTVFVGIFPCNFLVIRSLGFYFEKNAGNQNIRNFVREFDL